ncbi:hypothetical protein PUNSTDRAFT_126329, partial [Punctularia strigosozonata HHB-11173 SS5]|uniref:uncharacterized protein n=1 Tax=Punctularia strigosozonata (strain HHB-11173) TaxID=741275 RepID=UPI00044180D3
MASNSALFEIMVDDTDPRLVYRGPWNSRSNVQAEFNSTSHFTGNAGSTIQFTFNGTGIAVFGSIAPGGSKSTYSLDGAAGTPNNVAKTGHPLFQQMFFRSPQLQDGEHTLVITSETGGNSPFFLDYLEYTPSPAAIVAGMAGSGTAADAASTVSASSSNTGNNNQNNSNNRSKHNNNNNGDGGKSDGISKGDVAGIVIGALLALSCLVAVLVFAWRRNRRKRLMSPTPFEKARSLSDASFYSPGYGPDSLLPIHSSPVSVSPGDRYSRNSIIYSTSNSPSGTYWTNPFHSPAESSPLKLFASPVETERHRSYPTHSSAYGGVAYRSSDSTLAYDSPVER